MSFFGLKQNKQATDSKLRRTPECFGLTYNIDRSIKVQRWEKMSKVGPCPTWPPTAPGLLHGLYEGAK